MASLADDKVQRLSDRHQRKIAKGEQISPFSFDKLAMMRTPSLNVTGWCTAIVLGILIAFVLTSPASPQVPDLATGRIPTLAPLVRESHRPSYISVHGKIREDNPLYKDPLFREFFELPRQLEEEVSATGSGVIVDAQRGSGETPQSAVAALLL
jgi:serine protease Do